MQTAKLKPKIINKKLSNLFYTGQLTVPGPGVPPSIISGQVAKHIVDSNLLSLWNTFSTRFNKCSKLTTIAYSTSFSFGIKALDKKLHAPIYGIYGFVRFADEIVDTFHDYDKHYCWKIQTRHHMLLNEKLFKPTLNSFQKVVHDYNIEWHLIKTFLRKYGNDLDEEQAYDSDKYNKYILGCRGGWIDVSWVFVDGKEEFTRSLNQVLWVWGRLSKSQFFERCQ